MTQQGVRNGGLGSVHNSSSLQLLPPHTFPLLLRGVSKVRGPSGVSVGSSVGPPGTVGNPPSGSWSASFPPFQALVSAGLFLSRFSPLSQMLCSIFLPCVKYVATEVPPSWLVGSVVPCGGSVGTSCVRHGAALASPHGGHPCSPPLPAPGTCTQ